MTRGLTHHHATASALPAVALLGALLLCGAARSDAPVFFLADSAPADWLAGVSGLARAVTGERWRSIRAADLPDVGGPPGILVLPDEGVVRGQASQAASDLRKQGWRALIVGRPEASECGFRVEGGTGWRATPEGEARGVRCPDPALAADAWAFKPGPRGASLGDGPAERFVPLILATDRRSAVLGCVARLRLPNDGSGAAIELGMAPDARLAASVETLLAALRSPVALVRAGLEGFSYPARGPAPEVGAVIRNLAESELTCEAGFEVRTESGRLAAQASTLRVRVPPGGEASAPADLDLPIEPGFYALHTTLTCGGAVGDRIEQPFTVVAPPLPEDRTAVSPPDRAFRAGDRVVRPHGFDYSPTHSPPGKDAWLLPGWYDPAEIETDLALLERLGGDLVRVEYAAASQAGCLADFVTRCRRRRIAVLVSLAFGEPGEAGRDALLNRARAAKAAGVEPFAYEVLWTAPPAGMDDAGRAEAMAKLSWEVSRRCALVRGLTGGALLTARRDARPGLAPRPADLLVGAVEVDFLSAPHPGPGEPPMGLLSAWLAAVAPTKPVVWSLGGLDSLAADRESAYRALASEGCAGSVASQWAGEGGVVGPGRTLRTDARTLLRFAEDLRRGPAGAPDVLVEWPAGAARGADRLASVVEAYEEAGRRAERVGVRLGGLIPSSAALVATDGSPWEPGKSFRDIAGELGLVHVNGVQAPLDASASGEARVADGSALRIDADVANTGELTWPSGDVELRVEGPDGMLARVSVEGSPPPLRRVSLHAAIGGDRLGPNPRVRLCLTFRGHPISAPVELRITREARVHTERQASQ